MTFGEEWGWGSGKEEARKIYDAYREAGGNFIDTANLYTNGTSEKIVGELIASERDRWVAAVIGAKSEARITLTYPALESSRRTAFLVAGREKRAILARFRAGEDALPAARLRPAGTLLVFADAAAAQNDPHDGPVGS